MIGDQHYIRLMQHSPTSHHAFCICGWRTGTRATLASARTAAEIHAWENRGQIQTTVEKVAA